MINSNELENIIISLIDFKEKQRAIVKVGFDAIDFAKEYQTVAINPGRQTGKTTVIAKNAKQNDIVIARDFSALNNLLAGIKFFNITTGPAAGTISRITAVLAANPTQTFDTVWVDDAGYHANIDSVYQVLAGKCKRFVLIG